MNPEEKVFVAGHRGLVGSAVLKRLKAEGFCDIVTRTHAELDLTNQEAVNDFFYKERPAYVFLAAAKVGGIAANSNYPADFIYQNMMIGFNVVHAAYKSGVKKLLNLGSSCIYPRLAPQPLKEEYLLTGALEPTNEAYAVAKIAVIKLCASYNRQYGTNFISVMPANLYGPEDTYDTENGHVLPSMISKFHAAKTSGQDKVVLWGDGSPYREFLYSEDLAEAVLFIMQNKDASDTGEFVNIGSGCDLTIRELAALARDAVYADAPARTCLVEWDASKPNGSPKKLLDVSRLASWGWRAKTPLETGIKRAYEAFLSSRADKK
ncbi:MAG: GDP-L-fucose synthase [Spirochaetaceae bacterium]|jgi:GDP-L-fucose synthase|nr:GDP-L-fucose synthase [Spirochaetaceae bacterium]